MPHWKEHMSTPILIHLLKHVDELRVFIRLIAWLKATVHNLDELVECDRAVAVQIEDSKIRDEGCMRSS